MTEIKFDYAIPQFIEYLRSNGISQNTIEAYERVLNQFCNYVGNKSIIVSKQVVEQFLSKRQQEKKLTGSSLNLYISSISSFYNYFVDIGCIEYNPVSRIHRQHSEKPQIKIPKTEQITKFIHTLNSKHRILIWFMCSTGVRLSEACNLKVEQINFDEKSILIHGKGNQDYTVFVDEYTSNLLKKQISRCNSEYVFTGRGNYRVSPRTIQHIFEKYAPIGITPHSLRHFFASELFKNTRDIYLVQDSLGHRHIKSTELYIHSYTHLSLEERKSEYEKHLPINHNQIKHELFKEQVSLNQFF